MLDEGGWGKGARGVKKPTLSEAGARRPDAGARAGVRCVKTQHNPRRTHTHTRGRGVRCQLAEVHRRMKRGEMYRRIL